MQKLFTLIVIFSLLPMISSAQKWKRQRVEYIVGIGATNFLGDLGGADQLGSSGLRDLEFSATRYSFGFGYRYQLKKRLSVKGNLYYLKVSGDDALTEEPARAARMLNFKSNIIELSGQLEYTLLGSKSGSLYKLRGVKGKRSSFLPEIYVFGGVGGIWFDPKGKRDGKWQRLRPLHTEGQGLEDRVLIFSEDQAVFEAPGQYSGFSIIIPYGIGFKKSFGPRRPTQNWSISLELSTRITFTDYIDDVSGDYYGSDFIRDAFGDDAAFFADPSGIYTDHTLFGEPQKRGDSTNNDTYLLAIVSLNYKINKRRRRRSLPKF